MKNTEALIDDLIRSFNKDMKLGLEADWIRSSLAKGIEPEPDESAVDRDSGVVRGVAVVTKGEALGHNRLLDDAFLDETVEAGNKAKGGIKARFDHPNASNTSMGTAVGRFRKFRRDEDVVRADLHFLKSASKSPNGDYPDYIMSMAEEDPRMFGTSIVFTDEPQTQLDEDGKPIEGAPLLSRLQKLHAADVVDEPAANPNGFFSTGVQQSLASKLTQFLDRWLEGKGLAVQPIVNEPTHQEDSMDKSLKDENAEVVNDDKARETALAERARVKKLMARGRKLGCSDEFMDALLDEDIPMEEAYERIMDDADARQFTQKTNVLSTLEKEANESAGGGTDVPLETKPNLESMSLEDRCKHEFEHDQAIRDEFLTLSAYTAFKTHEGQSRLLTGRREKESTPA